MLDRHTSEICAELDGKKFPVDRAKVGVNLPPMHPYCRSTTVAVIEDGIWEMSDEEIDKLMTETDEDLGLNEDIPFDEWLNGLKETEDGKIRYVGTRKNVTETVDKSAGSGIIETGSDEVTISSIEQPIEQKHTGKGNPNAVLQFDVALNNRQVT